MKRPLLLDLFCCAGGAAMGYHRSGFEVIGVDLEPQPRYPFKFVQADALDVLSGVTFADLPYLEDFVVIHASPPCQIFSVTTPDRSKHSDLLTPTLELLRAMSDEVWYVVENVPPARVLMQDPVKICGSSLGLRVRRHRWFETNWPLLTPPCAHAQQGQPVGVYGQGSSKSQKRGRKADNEAEVLEVMGMPWADRRTATQAIPPAYTELIGNQLMHHIQNGGSG